VVPSACCALLFVCRLACAMASPCLAPVWPFLFLHVSRAVAFFLSNRAREERARADTMKVAKQKEGLFFEKREAIERVAMAKEELRSRNAEVRGTGGSPRESSGRLPRA